MATIDLGKIKLVWRGTWSNSPNPAYSVDDLVEYTDTGVTSTYIAVSTPGSQVPSSSGSVQSNWNLVAKGVVDPIPNQSGNANKFLKTDGQSTLSWANAGKPFAMNASQTQASYTSSTDLLECSFVTTKNNPTCIVYANIAWNVNHSGNMDPKNVRFDLFYKINSGSWIGFSDNAYATDVPAIALAPTHDNQYDVTQRSAAHKNQITGVSAGDTLYFKVIFDASGMAGNTFHWNRSTSTGAEGCSTIMALEE